MKRPVALLAAALLLPGCFFVHRAVPLDASGMEFPLRHFGATVTDQSVRTGETVAGIPSAFAGHLRYCWRNLTVDPTEE